MARPTIRRSGPVIGGLFALGGFVYAMEVWVRSPWWVYPACLGAMLLLGLILRALGGAARRSLRAVDNMTGEQFEEYVARLLRRHRFSRVALTAVTGDYGADIVAHKGGERYIFQCKRYGRNIGITPVQEIHAAASHYESDREVVVTNAYFTPNAYILAEETCVDLWDRDDLAIMMRGRKRRFAPLGREGSARQGE